ncbi:MAG: hypothetical protein BWK78_07260, partial [Thiotrichaceae bacterium IS1]
DDSVPNCIISIGQLTYGKTYFWQVTATDVPVTPSSLSTKGPIWYFTTRENNPPYAPVEPTPEDLSENQATEQTLSWEWEGKSEGSNPDPDNDEVTYNVYVGTKKSDFYPLNAATPCPNVSSSILNCFQTGLDYDTKYYWQVVAKDAGDSTNKGLLWEFNTGGTKELEANFEVNISEGFAPLTVYFTDKSIGNGLTWLWDFGVLKLGGGSTENETSTDQNPSFPYNAVDDYTVTLTVTDVDGNKSTKTMLIKVKELTPVSLIVRPGVDNMNLEWSAQEIGYVPSPNDAVIQFYRSADGTTWSTTPIESVKYMDSLTSASQYFDKTGGMTLGSQYCYYFKVMSSSTATAYALAQSKVACDTFGAVRVFIGQVAAAPPGGDVFIPVKIANAQNLAISNGLFSLSFNGQVINALDGTMSVIPSPLLTNSFGGALYTLSKIGGDSANPTTVKFNFDDSGEGKLFGSQEDFFWIKSKVVSEATAGQITDLTWNPSDSSMTDSGGTGITLSFTGSTFNVKKGTRDGERSITAGTFTVDSKGILGDPDLNGVLDAEGAKRVLRHIVNPETYPLDSKQIAAADANGNGKVDANDAGMILSRSFTGKWPFLSTSNPSQTDNNSPLVIKLNNVSGVSGTDVETLLTVENLSDFNSGEFLIQYDPAVVESITEVKRTLTTSKFNVFFYDDTQGTLRIAMACQDAINGNADLATLKVHLKANSSVRKGSRSTRDGVRDATNGEAKLILAQTLLYNSKGLNYVTSRLQRTVERHNAEVVRTDVPVEDTTPDTGNPGGNTDNTTPSKPNAHGYVVDQVGNPIANATIQLNGKTLATDEMGYWQVDELDKGEYNLAISKEGYTFPPRNFTIESDDVVVNTRVQDATVSNVDKANQLHKMFGFILDDSNNPIADVTVKVGTTTTTTNASGYWKIVDFTNGQYSVTANKVGYNFVPKEVTINNENVVVDLKLVKTNEVVGPYKVGGQLMDKAGNPLANVAIQVGDKTTTTDVAGNWEIGGLFEGTYDVFATKDNFSCLNSGLELGNEEYLQVVNCEPVTTLKVVVKPDTWAAIGQGEELTYTITVINGGKDTATGVTLIETLPAGSELVSLEALDGGVCDANTLSCTLPDLTPGATAKLKLVLRATDGKNLKNVLTLTSKEYPVDVQTSWKVVKPYLSVTVTDTPDPVVMLGTLHYTAQVELSANAPQPTATGVTYPAITARREFRNRHD